MKRRTLIAGAATLAAGKAAHGFGAGWLGARGGFGGLGAGGTNIADWFVDSVAGNDGNSGKSPSAPFATIGAMLTAVGSKANQRIALKRGSSWSEQFILGTQGSPINGTKILAYGSGAIPLIDAGDTIANGNFTLVPATSFTYQATVSVTGTTGTEQRLIWENNANLVQVAFSVGVELATPGTFAFSSYSAASATVYVRASDSSNVSTNGKTYVYSSRFAAIMLAGNDCSVTGIRTRRQRANDGSLVMYGDRCWAYSNSIEDGCKHASLTAEGGGYIGNTFKNVYNGTGGTPNFVVFNKNVGTSLGMTVQNNTFLQDPAVVPSSASYPISAANASSVISHINTSGNLGNLIASGNTHTNCATGYSISNGLGQTLTGETFINCQQIAAVNEATTLNISNSSHTFNLSPAQVGSVDGIGSNLSSGSATVNYTNVTINTGTYDLRLPGNLLASNFSACAITIGNTSARFPLGALRVTGTGAIISVNGTSIALGFASDAFYNLNTDTVYSGNNNSFTGFNVHWNWAVNGANVVANTTSGASAIAAWRAYCDAHFVVGQDSSSTAQ